MSGINPKYAIIDEASEINEDIWKYTINNASTATMPEVLVLKTPMSITFIDIVN